jgi:hypothetical protein
MKREGDRYLCPSYLFSDKVGDGGFFGGRDPLFYGFEEGFQNI